MYIYVADNSDSIIKLFLPIGFLLWLDLQTSGVGSPFFGSSFPFFGSGFGSSFPFVLLHFGLPPLLLFDFSKITTINTVVNTNAYTKIYTFLFQSEYGIQSQV